jgi:ribose/xylose/arabinose/galactoside ABC-type transport system permease subunit
VRSVVAYRVRPYLMPLLVLVVTWVAMAWISPSFRGEGSVYAVLENLPLLGLIALAISVTMIAGELDLSVGSMAAMAGVLGVEAAGHGLVQCISWAVAICVVVGAVQGLIIAWTGINSLVFTIGTLILLRGVTYLLSGGPNGQAPVTLEDFSVSDALLAKHWIFSVSSIVALVVFAVIGLFLALTRAGREIYAIGGARPEAVAAGVSTTRSMTIVFGVSGGCAALAGSLASLRGGSAAPENYGDLLLTGVAAAALGGVSLWGGRGTVFNVLIGVFVLGVVTAGLAARGAEGSTVQLITGALLLGVIALEFLDARIAGRLQARSHSGPGTASPAPASETT